MRTAVKWKMSKRILVLWIRSDIAKIPGSVKIAQNVIRYKIY